MKIDKLDFIKIKSFVLWRILLKGGKDNYILGDNIFKPQSEKELVSRIFKGLSKHNHKDKTKQRKNPIKLENRKRDMNKYFTKEDI